MAMDDLPPVYLGKIKGARVVYYRDGNNSSNKASQVLVGLVFAVLSCTFMCVSVWDCTWDGQCFCAAIMFSIVLSRILVFTLYLLTRSVGISGAAACTCDHEHDDTWGVNVERNEHGDGFIEAGTVINWGIKYVSGVQKFHGDGGGLVGESHADTIVDYLLQVQWDCGSQKVYSMIEQWKQLRVFDMGPTGTFVHLV